MRLIIVAFVLSASAAAHAMGQMTSYDVLAWSSDGTSALLSLTVTNSGGFGSTRDYVIVTASEKKWLDIAVTNTLSLDEAKEKVDVATCTRNADVLAKALAARRFKGLKVEKDQCSTAGRELIAIPPEVAQVAAQSWVVSLGGSTVHKPPTKRETAALAAARSIRPEGALVAASVGDGTLTLVIYQAHGEQGSALAYFNSGKLVAKDL